MRKAKMSSIFFDKKALKKMHAVIITAIIIVAALAGAVYYSILTSSTPATPPTEMKLTYTWSTDVVTMDPHTGWSTDTLMIVRVCYERLVRLQGSTMNLEGELAKDWSVSADGLTYTFNLRENVTFDDGSPFNATAVKKSFDRLIGIGQQSQNFLALKEISIVDQNTVKFTLNYAFAPFINALATMQASIININALEKHKTTDDPWAINWFHDWTNGTGPYMIQEWQKGTSWTMIRNPYYWRGWEGRHFTKLTGLVTSQAATARMMLEKGDSDLGGDLVSYLREDIPLMMLNPDLRIIQYPALSTLYLALNCQKGPCNDVHVRRAVSYAFDYGAALAILLYNGKQSRGPMPSALLGWSNETMQYMRNTTKAKEELAQSAYPQGGFTLSYLYCAGDEQERRVGELLQANLRDIDVNVDVEVQPWATLAETQTNPETAKDIVALYQFDFAPDPHFDLYDRFHSSRIPPAGYNWDYYNNTMEDQLLDDATTEQNVNQRMNLYHQAAEILAEEAVAVFVWEETKPVALRATVFGFIPNPCLVETYNFYDMYKVE